MGLATSACAMEQGYPDETGEAPAEDGVAQSDQALKTGWPVPSGHIHGRTSAQIPGCTAVIIGKRDMLTAAHCNPQAGAPVRFYNGSTRLPFDGNMIAWRSVRPGVNIGARDYTDSAGKFADIAYLRLTADIPSTSRIARLPKSFPGNNRWARRVGAGNHNSGGNPERVLHYDNATTYSAHVNDGHFLVSESDVDFGDSGGPLHIWASNGQSSAYEVQGVLFGTAWEWAWRSKYTSTLHHIDWIAARIYNDPADRFGYRSGQRQFGTVLERLAVNSISACRQYCRQRTDCDGANIRTIGSSRSCELVGNIVYTGPFTNYSAITRTP